jgi:hypothetical protein
MSLILSGSDGLSDIDGSAATPAIRGTDANTGIFFPAADTIAFATGGTEDARFNSAGNLQTLGTISVGNATPSTSGAGITFPATQSASSDANTLDDYEEGTFTVGVRGSNTAGTYTIVGQINTYTKIGRLVSLTIFIPGFSVASGGTGYLQVTGLPFTNIATTNGTLSGNNLDFSVSTLYVGSAFITSSGTSTLYLEETKDNGSATDFAISGISTSSTIKITLTYSTS